jgi:hemoglobin
VSQLGRQGLTAAGMPARDCSVSLYDRVGGANAMPALVEHVYAAVLKDPLLRPYFAGAPMDKLKRMQVEVLSTALGGPASYSGRPITQAHRHLGITLVAFQRFVQILFDVLQRYELSEQECYDVISRLDLYSNDVVSIEAGYA